MPPYHPDLVLGVATYARELFDAVGDLDTVYVGVGMGTGISGLIGVRDLLGLHTEIVGVVSERAPATALSFAAARSSRLSRRALSSTASQPERLMRAQSTSSMRAPRGSCKSLRTAARTPFGCCCRPRTTSQNRPAESHWPVSCQNRRPRTAVESQ